MTHSKMRFDIVTLFPEIFASSLTHSILKRSMELGEVEFILHDIRQYSVGKRRSVDDLPYGGGAGMVLKAHPVIDAVKGVPAIGGKKITIFLTPRGGLLTQKLVQELAGYRQIVLVAGHYEGIDERACESVCDREVSVGDYILTGGEIPAMVLVDAVSRLVPGVLGNALSHQDESFDNSLLEYPQYTRPYECNGRKVPEVLLSGDPKAIDMFRREKSLEKTLKVRPDLLRSRQQGEVS